MSSLFTCPFCAALCASSTKACTQCGERFPWSDEVESLRNDLKAREPSRIRAIFNLAEEIQIWAGGGKPPSLAAIKGLIYALLFPRLVLVVGSVAASVVLIAQTAIMYRQNEILSTQTSLISAQSMLMRDAALAADAQRFLPLYPELIQLLNDMNALGRKSARVPLSETIPLPDSLTSRIITLSRAFRPYWFIDSYSSAADLRIFDTRSSQLPMVFLSPERGLLLKGLIANRLDVTPLALADFSFADMRGAEIKGYYPEEVHYTFPEFGSCTALASGRILSTKKDRELVSSIRKPHDEQTVYLWDLEPLQLENADFSLSTLSGVRIQDEFGTLRFKSARLANVYFSSVRRVDLSDANIFSVSVNRYDGQSPAQVIVSRARFMSDPLCSDEEIYQSDDDLTIKHPQITINPQDAKDVFVREDLIKRNFLSHLKFDRSTLHSSGNPRWDFVLLQARSK